MNGETPIPPAKHVPVLATEVLELLSPIPGQILVDATVGAGGHARLLAEQVGSTGKVLGFDRDPAMLDLAAQHLEGLPVTLTQGSFAQLRQLLDQMQVSQVDAILADLGFCSDQMESAERGLSFQQEGPLDMRLNPAEDRPAADLIRRLSEHQLADLFWQYGDERFSRRIARKIVETRRREPIETTTQLAALIRRCVPRPKGRRGSIDPATRVFQALRIAVNDEMAALDQLLQALPRCLRPGGRAVIISFHSLEDRKVKHTFRNREVWTELTRKPIQAGEEELAKNPRARSAKLRAAVIKESGSKPTGSVPWEKDPG